MSNEPLKKQNVSPRAPYLDLQQSLNIISMLKNVGLQNATFNKEQFFKAIGSSSGAAVRKLAGLGYYGLLTKSGKGEYKISKEAKEAVIGGDINEERKFELLQEFSLNPGVFKSLYEQFGSDSAMEALSSYLQVKHTPPHLIKKPLTGLRRILLQIVNLPKLRKVYQMNQLTLAKK